MFTTSEHKKVFSRTILIPYHPKLSKNICKNFEQHDIRVIESSNEYKLKNCFQSTKVWVQVHRSEQTANLKALHGTSKSIQKQQASRFSCTANHMLYKDDRPRSYKHNFDHTCLKLLKRVAEPYKLDAFESIDIQRDTTGKLKKLDERPLKSSLFDIL
jgi:hypothetical protein